MVNVKTKATHLLSVDPSTVATGIALYDLRENFPDTPVHVACIPIEEVGMALEHIAATFDIERVAVIVEGARWNAGKAASVAATAVIRKCKDLWPRKTKVKAKVDPRTWRKSIYGRIAKGTDTARLKALSLGTCAHLNIDHHGDHNIAEAVLIGQYGLSLIRSLQWEV